MPPRHGDEHFPMFVKFSSLGLLLQCKVMVRNQPVNVVPVHPFFVDYNFFWSFGFALLV
jgi:hypothetical protein